MHQGALAHPLPLPAAASNCKVYNFSERAFVSAADVNAGNGKSMLAVLAAGGKLVALEASWQLAVSDSGPLDPNKIPTVFAAFETVGDTMATLMAAAITTASGAPAAPASASAGATTVPAGASAGAQATVAAKPTPILFMDNAIRLAPFKQASYTGASLGSRDTPILGYSHGIAVQKRLPESEAHKQCLKDLATVAMAGDGCTEVRVRKARAGMLN